MIYDEIRPYAQIIDIIVGSIINTIDKVYAITLKRKEGIMTLTLVTFKS